MAWKTRHNVKTHHAFFGPVPIEENQSNVFKINEDVAYTNKKPNC